MFGQVNYCVYFWCFPFLIFFNVIAALTFPPVKELNREEDIKKRVKGREIERAKERERERVKERVREKTIFIWLPLFFIFFNAIASLTFHPVIDLNRESELEKQSERVKREIE